MRRATLGVFLVLAACGGRPVQSKQDLADSLAFASIPSTGVKGGMLSLYGSAAVPEPSFTVRGLRGGEARVSINPLGGAIGVAAGGVLFDVDYSGFSEDGLHRLDGHVSVIATFDYHACACQAESYADLKLSLVGTVQLSGVISDDLRFNVSVITRFHDLEFREDSIELFLKGQVTAHGDVFDFADENLTVSWQQR